MPKYKVEWSKTYYASGVVEVEAKHEDDAHDLVCDQMGYYKGTIQYEANEDHVRVISGLKMFS